MDRIPQALAAALLAGVLTRFALDAFAALRSDFVLVGGMLAVYLLGRRLWPRYAVPGAAAGGSGAGGGAGSTAPGGAGSGMPLNRCGRRPNSACRALVGVALPLFVVTMASQNLPGVAAQRAAGYNTPVSPVITATGLCQRCCWPRSAATPTTWRPSPRPSAWAAKPMKTRRGATPRR
jgi:benzoate membrane transport protein